MERLLSDEGIETRNQAMSFALCQYVAHDGVREPVYRDTDQAEDAGCWGLPGYLDCLEHVVEWWDHDDSDHRMRRWVETVIVPPG